MVGRIGARGCVQGIVCNLRNCAKVGESSMGDMYNLHGYCLSKPNPMHHTTHSCIIPPIFNLRIPGSLYGELANWYGA